MSLESTSTARRHAVEVSGDAGVVEGPLKGYHHETYVFPLPGEDGVAQPVRWKCREPRSGLLWFDRRCFRSEEQLLGALQGRIARIPDIIDVGSVGLQRFIEGSTLGARYKFDKTIPDAILDQIVDLFRQMVRVTPGTLSVERRCADKDRPEDGDTTGFLERLICFTEEHVYEKNFKDFGELFGSLGVDGDSFGRIRKHVSGLKERPFCLLHADLHRENFIIDPDDQLWTIDWELAMLGDPLYDLATHLYLMRYPVRQERRMVQQWCNTVEEIRPGSSNGWERDLPLILDYKRFQSVFTDTVRVSQSLIGGPGFNWGLVPRAGWKLYKVLTHAAAPLGLEVVPSPWQIMSALVRWGRVRGAAAGDRCL